MTNTINSELEDKVNNDLRDYLKNTSDLELKIKYAQELQKIVPFDGWCIESLTIASRNLGYPDHYHKLIFTEGVADALSFYEEYANAKMLLALAQNSYTSNNAKIEDALNIRIFQTAGSKMLARKTAAYYSKPQHAGLALRAAWQTADAIWYAAGDRTTDYNYYTKRTLLGSIYLASLIYYLNHDGLDNNQQTDTAAFIAKAIAKTTDFAKLTKKIKLPTITDIPIIRMFF